MNIILDGLSGVGKTYLGEKLAQRLDLNFYEFIPDIEHNSESALHSYAIDRQSKTDMTIIEGSFVMSEVIKMWMYENNLIPLEQYLRVKSMSIAKIKPFVVIFIQDETKDIIKRRKARGREFEFTPEIKDMASIDNYINEQVFKLYEKYNIPVIVHYRELYTNVKQELEVLESLVYAITKQL